MHNVWTEEGAMALIGITALRKAPKMVKIIGAAAGIPAGLGALYTLVSHGVFHRSNLGTATEVYLRATGGGKKLLRDMVLLDNAILQSAETNDRRYTIPTSVDLEVASSEEIMAGYQVFHLNRRPINDRAVIYIHGGCYLNQPSPEHWKFVDTIAQRTRAEVVMPLYPLTPVHGAREAMFFLEDVYRATVDKYGVSNVTIMGDSCGGGIAASFAEHLPTLDLEQPGHLILISPWVDATLRNPDILAYEKTDPILGVQGLQKLGLTWAKDLDANDYRVSPVNGEVRNLRNVAVFVGTREIFYPDARLFYDRVNATGVHAELYVGRGLNHNYPLYPIPEAKWAINRIVEIICTD